VHQYKRYLKDTHTAFYEGPNPVALNACAYLHNYHLGQNDILFSNKFVEALSSAPLFAAADANKLSGYLTTRLDKGVGLEVLKRIEQSKYRPSKKLMDHVANVIKGVPEYILLDEQQIVYDSVISCAKAGYHDKQKTVLIIKGGPGTGKSVIAINLMADLLQQGYNAQYATGSRAFTETLKKRVKARASAQFKYFNSYTEAQDNEIDVLIADEAHRLRQTSFNRFTPKEKRTNNPQIEELLKACKVAAFFIDDDQIVRPGEIGSVQYIREYSKRNNCRVFEYELEAQFRCNGSETFVNWVNNTLGIKRTANVIWDQHEEFDLQVMGSPQELEDAIRSKVQAGYTGRLMAGFCWPWSDPDSQGNLRNDVKIGEYERPWNAKPESRILAAGIPKSNLWAYDPNGIEQIGCVYTAQGFEFDYAGVIFGKDLTYDLDRQQWVGNPACTADNIVRHAKGTFTDLIKNTYRVLLSRGMKGCYVHFLDKDTERFFKSRIE
jgi:hypothetical protein